MAPSLPLRFASPEPGPRAEYLPTDHRRGLAPESKGRGSPEASPARTPPGARQAGRSQKTTAPAASHKERDMRERRTSRSFFHNFFRFLSAALLCALTCAAALAQSTATLQGAVTDQQGAVVPNAKVTVRSQATSTERTAQTDADGNYQFASLLPGVYDVEVQAQGFQTQAVAALNVEVARTVVQNFQLTVGNVSQTITVASDAPVIETATTSVGTVISQRTVQEIPLNGRHFVDLGLLIPGSVTPPQNGFLTAPLRGQRSEE